MRGRVKPVVLCLVLMLPHVRALGQSSDSADWPKRILNEMTELRADLMEYLLNAQDRKTKELTREVEEARQNQKRLQEEESQRLQQVAQVEQQLESPQLEPPMRSQIEAWQLHLTTERAEQLRTEQAGWAQREAQVVQQLDREMQRGQKLQERARQLQASLRRR